MNASRKLSGWLAGVASVGLCLPVAPAAAGDGAHTASSVASAIEVRDVELGYGGLLIGRLVDVEGQPVAGSSVSILANGKTLAATQTDRDGVFAVAKLRGGVHQIALADALQTCRLWTNGTAPPHAPQSIEIVAGSDVIRGQWGPPPGNRLIKKSREWLTNPFVIGGVVAAAIALPIALSDDDGPHS